MIRVLLLATSVLLSANLAAQMPSDNELKQLFSMNVALAESGDNDAQMAVCSAYSYGLGTAPSAGQALAFCSLAAKAGIPRAQLLVADAYLQGSGTEPDVAAASYWYEQATKTGMAQGHIGLASIYFDLDNVLGTRNLELAAFHAKQAAAAGSHMGEMYLGIMHFNGFEPGVSEGTEIDYAASMLWFEKSAQKGNMISAAYLVNIYASETAHQSPYKAYLWASVLKKHLPDAYPEDVHFESAALLTSTQREAAAEQLLLIERGWHSLSGAAASI
ncbi:MAG: tetratricopeptide repeat protein [Pseudomonadota bacterium]